MVTDINRVLRDYLPHLKRAKAENLNEADTVARVAKVFESVLGWDPLREISREARVKGRFVDLALKLKGRTVLLVEVKAAGVALRERHIEQAARVAERGNIPWVALTNGTAWILYHLDFEDGIDPARALAFDCATDRPDKCAACLGLLHRTAVRGGALEAFWSRRVALGPASLGRALFREEVLRLIRREIRHAEGIPIDLEDLARALQDLFTVEAREQLGPLKIRGRRPPRPRPARTHGSASAPGGVAPVESAGGVALIPDAEVPP